jgi:hypothetical protein
VPASAWSVIAKQHLWWNCVKQKFEAWTEQKPEEKPEDEPKGDHYVQNVKGVQAALERQQLDQRMKEKLQGTTKSKYNATKRKVP